MIAERVNIVVLGSGGVGKSSITIGFINGDFLDEYDPTIEDSYSKNITVDGKEFQLDITDTAGQEEYRGLWSDKFLRGGDGFVLVYTITLKSSFEELESIHSQITRAREDDHVPIIVVGNKCDLADLREVSEQEAQAFADKIGGIKIESSAKSKINVNETFVKVVQEVVKKNHALNAPKERVTDNDHVKSGCCAIL